MRTMGNARRPRVCATAAAAAAARPRDADIYRRYAVGQYRQALFGSFPYLQASRLPERIHPRDIASAVRAALRRFTAVPAAAVETGNLTSQKAGEK
jgi:hypothetical protein